MYGDTPSWWQRNVTQRFQPTAIQLASAELKDAELAVLQCHSQAEYAALRHQIYNLEREYHEGRVKRLGAFLDDLGYRQINLLKDPDYAENLMSTHNQAMQL